MGLEPCRGTPSPTMMSLESSAFPRVCSFPRLHPEPRPIPDPLLRHRCWMTK